MMGKNQTTDASINSRGEDFEDTYGVLEELDSEIFTLTEEDDDELTS